MKKNKNLLNQRVLITGASSGLGEQLAYEVSRRKGTVVLVARNEERLSEVLEKCEEVSGQEGYIFPMDLSEENDFSSFKTVLKEEVGQIDILINCAGFGLFKDCLDFDKKVISEMFQVNVLSLIGLTQEIASSMKKRGHGQIVNIASQAGKMATPKSSIYAATKFSVVGFSDALRLELAPFGVKVLTVNPGPIKTNFFNRADETGDYLKSVERIVLDPKKLARQIMNACYTSKREVNTPKIMAFGSKCYVLFPKIGDFFAGKVFNTK